MFLRRSSKPMSKKVRFRGQLLFVFVERRPSSSDTVLDLSGLLWLECNHLTKIFDIFQYFHFDTVYLHFFCTVPALAAKDLRFSWMYLESHLFCAMFEVAQHFLKLLLCRSKKKHVVSKAQIREAVVVVISYANAQSFFLPNPFSFAIVGGHLSKPPVEQC